MLLDRIVRAIGVLALAAALFVPLIVAPYWIFPYITGKITLFHACVDIALICLGILVVRGAASVAAIWQPIGWCLLAFVAAMLVADLGAPHPPLALFSTIERSDGFTNLAWMAGYFVACAGLLRGYWERYAACSLAVCLSLLPLCVIHLLWVWPYPLNDIPRAYATVGNPSYMGGYAMLHVFLALWLWTRGWRWFGPIAAIGATLVLVMSQTRGAALGLGAGITILLYLRGGWRQRQIMICAATGIAVLAVLVLSPTDSIPWLDRWKPRLANERWEVWGVAWRAFLERPLTGWGHEGFAWAWRLMADPASANGVLPYDRAHNFVMDRLVEGGAAGTAAYLALIAAAARAARREPALAGMLTAYLVSNLFIFDVILTQMPFMALLAMLATLENRDVARHARAVQDHKALLHVRKRRAARAA